MIRPSFRARKTIFSKVVPYPFVPTIILSFLFAGREPKSTLVMRGLSWVTICWAMGDQVSISCTQVVEPVISPAERWNCMRP